MYKRWLTWCLNRLKCEFQYMIYINVHQCQNWKALAHTDLDHCIRSRLFIIIYCNLLQVDDGQKMINCLFLLQIF